MSERASLERVSSARFLARRRLRRRRLLIALSVILCILLGVFLWGIHQSALRISHVTIYGADPLLATYATNAMRGSYLGIIPRNSTFFFPSETIRRDILAEHPEIAALSLFRSGLSALSIKVDYRVAIARWCGLAPTAGVDEYCYVFDASGFVFAAAAASSTQTINSFKLYVPLEGESLEPPVVSVVEPLRATLAQAQLLPSTFDFARQLSTFGSSVLSIVIHDGEVDDYLESSTRVTYVLGDEQNAFTALVSARKNLNLADGSLDYVDLRFDGKMYVKKK